MLVFISTRLGLTPASFLISIGAHVLVAAALTAGAAIDTSHVRTREVEESMAFNVAFEEPGEQINGDESVEPKTQADEQTVVSTSQPMLLKVQTQKKSVVSKKVSESKIKPVTNPSDTLGIATHEIRLNTATVVSSAEDTVSLNAWVNRHKFYPQDARRRGEEGTVLVRINVNQIGELESYQVIKSSGSLALDRAAAEILKRSAPYPEGFSQRSASAEIPLTFTLQS